MSSSVSEKKFSFVDDEFSLGFALFSSEILEFVELTAACNHGIMIDERKYFQTLGRVNKWIAAEQEGVY